MTALFLVAGEASGDALGAALIRGLRQLEPGIALQGIAGPMMQSEGLTSLFPMEELSVMGIAEILPKYFHLKRRIAETARAVVAAKPDALVTIDSPDFSLRVAKLVRAAAPEIKIVHYVAPSVWAWRPGRARKMAPMVDQVLALLPFEPPYMTAAGMRCDFVGHPIVAQPKISDADAQAFRARLDIPAEVPLVVALPGSRRSEVSRLSPVFGAALGQFLAQRPEARIVVPAARSVAGLVKQQTDAWPFPVQVLDPRPLTVEAAEIMKRTAFRAADVALAASGTVSLELAAAEAPMVVGYDMAWLTMKITQAMALIDTVTLVNLVSETRLVPEFLGQDFTPDALSRALVDMLDAPESQLEAARVTMSRLGAGGDAPGLRAARAVLDGLSVLQA
ncbi:lipid-A-disaccharide synthase [Pseudoruegeria sp. SK021]|uniref:lipid-A-disaccharide synthase n=1 Tax=Pseudoruegeria sp. SK021 TaxID=1933035 RepID=UPI000A21680A|nr:lipid-A-disaccharide synthase [Pseudoruegeria sp. SK021]OSP53633.1 lipid-A-disaccharide synthase [Pseudoruegeria sp. SK021]